MKVRILFASLSLTALSFWQVLPNQTLAQISEQKDLVTQAPRPVLIGPTGYQPKPISPESQLGESYFKELNCLACHSIRNTGGVLGPLLDGVGAHRNSEYLFAHLASSPEQINKLSQLTGISAAQLHHPRVSEATAHKLVAYLESLAEPPGGFILSPHVKSEPAEIPKCNPAFKPLPISKNSSEGKNIFDKQGCTACHSISGLGGWMGPQLDGIAGRHSRQYILEHISSPKIMVRESTEQQETWPQMPKLNLADQDIEKIADYLMTLPNAPKNK
jgi:cytochrome c2